MDFASSARSLFSQQEPDEGFPGIGYASNRLIWDVIAPLPSSSPAHSLPKMITPDVSSISRVSKLIPYPIIKGDCLDSCDCCPKRQLSKSQRVMVVCVDGSLPANKPTKERGKLQQCLNSSSACEIIELTTRTQDSILTPSPPKKLPPEALE